MYNILGDSGNRNADTKRANDVPPIPMNYNQSQFLLIY